VHYYKFNIAGWTLSTSHLSLIEEAIYFRLINHYYDTEKPIPLDTHSVFRRLRIGNDSDIGEAILKEFFTLTDSGWVQSRCEENLKEYKKTSKKNKANGLKGGRPSKNAASSVSQNKPTGLDSVSQNNPNYKLLTKNYKPETTNQYKNIFDVFWKAYPKKQSKDQAEKSWLKLKPDEILFDSILSKIELFKTSNEWTKDGGQFIPNASTWLNQKRWNDELTYGVIDNGQNRFRSNEKQSLVSKANSDSDRLRAAIASRRKNESILELDDPSVSTQMDDFRGGRL